jgi:hypothetical protein
MSARALSLAVVALLLLGACSDDNNQVPKVEKDEMIKKADAICKDANADLAANAKGASTTDKAAALLLLNTELLPRLDRELGDTKDLGLPKNDRVDWDAYVLAFDTALSTLKDAANEDPLQALAGAQAVFASARARAKTFGLTECA